MRLSSAYVEERPCWSVNKPQQRKKEYSERLRGEGDQIKFIDLRFERWQVVGLSYVGERP